jgi:hypothetical protein
VFVAAQFLAQDQIQYAQAQGDIALGLIAVYRAVGGGWDFRLTEQAARVDAAAAACHVIPQQGESGPASQAP